MSVKVTTQPTIEPVQSEDMQAHINVDASQDRNLIEGYITAARRTLEQLMWRAFINQTITLTLDAFPTGSEPIYVPRAPLSSVTSITYIDTDEASQTWASSNYDLDTNGEPGRIALAVTKSYPGTSSAINAVTITYVAGFGATPQDVPEDIRHAIMLLVAHWYQNREAAFQVFFKEMPLGVQMLIANNKVNSHKVLEYV